MELRARWYHQGNGTFTAKDPFAGWAEQPYSLRPYAYALGDPVLYRDPTGRTWYLNSDEVADLDNSLDAAIAGNNSTTVGVAGGTVGVAQYFIVKKIVETAGLPSEMIPASGALGLLGALVTLGSVCENYNLDRLNKIEQLVSMARNNHSASHSDSKATGIAIMYNPTPERFLGGGDLHALNRINGSHYILHIEGFFGNQFPRSMYPDLVAYNFNDVMQGFHFAVGLPVRVLPPVPSG